MPKDQKPEDPKKRPARKAAGPKKTPKPAPRKKAVPPKPAPAPDASTLAKTALAQASAAAGKTVRKAKMAAPPPEAVKVDEDAPSVDDALMGCTPRQSRFVDLYLLLNFNATKAYKEAGYEVKSDNVASTLAARMLGNARVRTLLAARAKQMLDNVEAEKDRLMRTYTATAFADVRELVGYHRGSCRFCWGKAHRYQFSAGEWDAKMLAFEERQDKAAEEGKKAPSPPDPRGGTGYDWNLEPNPACPECSGLGEGRTVIADTRNLSPDAAALYAGIEETKDGLKLKMHDQMKARETLAKIRKLVDEDPKVAVVFDAGELDRLYAEKMQRSRARGAAMRAERFGDRGNG